LSGKSNDCFDALNVRDKRRTDELRTRTKACAGVDRRGKPRRRCARESPKRDDSLPRNSTALHETLRECRALHLAEPVTTTATRELAATEAALNERTTLAESLRARLKCVRLCAEDQGCAGGSG